MRDILSVLVSTPRFGTFLRVLVATHLLEDLRGAGPYLVLAPSDAAFAKLSLERRAELERLFQREGIEKLIDFAEMHVLQGPTEARRPRLGPPVAARYLCSNGEIQVVERVVWPWPEPEVHGWAKGGTAALGRPRELLVTGLRNLQG